MIIPSSLPSILPFPHFIIRILTLSLHHSHRHSLTVALFHILATILTLIFSRSLSFSRSPYCPQPHADSPTPSFHDYHSHSLHHFHPPSLTFILLHLHFYLHSLPFILNLVLILTHSHSPTPNYISFSISFSFSLSFSGSSRLSLSQFLIS